MIQENQKWIISTIMAALALIIPIALYMFSLTEKKLEYEVISQSEIIGKDISMDKIEIKIGEESVNCISISTFKIRNSGTEPILKSDFERPILIMFSEGTKIYTSKLKHKIPENLSLKYRENGNNLLIEPLLFNSGDEFEMEILSSSNSYPKIDTRIAGVKEMTTTYPDSRKVVKRSIFLFLIYILVFYYSKFFRSLLSRNINRRPSVVLHNAILSLTCCSSVVFLLKEVLIDIEVNKYLVLLPMMIPLILGVIYAKKEEEYDEENQQIVNADAPAEL